MPTSKCLPSARQKLKSIQPRFHTNLLCCFTNRRHKSNTTDTEKTSPSITSMDTSGCKIRLYEDKDEDEVMEICRVTAHEKAQQEPVRTVVPYVFALPYIKLHPEYCWVVADKDDKAVGYIVAVPDSAEYLRRIKDEYFPLFEAQYLPELEVSNPGLFDRPAPAGTTSLDASMSPGNEIERIGGGGGGPEAVAAGLIKRFWAPDESILHSTWPALLEEYPCHLHIDILPEFAGQQFGRKLMDHLKEKLKAKKVEGIHLIKSGNGPTAAGTEKFYNKMGFKRYPFKMGGETNEKDVGVKKGGGVCMVQKLN